MKSNANLRDLILSSRDSSSSQGSLKCWWNVNGNCFISICNLGTAMAFYDAGLLRPRSHQPCLCASMYRWPRKISSVQIAWTLLQFFNENLTCICINWVPKIMDVRVHPVMGTCSYPKDVGFNSTRFITQKASAMSYKFSKSLNLRISGPNNRALCKFEHTR